MLTNESKLQLFHLLSPSREILLYQEVLLPIDSSKSLTAMCLNENRFDSKGMVKLFGESLGMNISWYG
jgi:hypothetical protein